MGILIDARSSQNINSAFPPPPSFFPANVPVLIGQVGLNVPPFMFTSIRVQFDAIVGFALPTTGGTAMSALLVLVRGTTFAGGIVNQIGLDFNPTDTGSHVLPFSASDSGVTAPLSGSLVYTLYAIFSTGTVLRTGPENLNAAAYAM